MPHPVSATVPGRHADHNLLLVSTNAAGDATGRELDEALALVAGCPDCAALHHDLRAIAAAMAALPAPVRTRDFRLTPEQAAALRPVGWRRLLAPFAGPRFSFAAPLGTALATLGIAGILVSGGMPLSLSGATSGAAGNEAAEVPAVEQLAAPAAGAPGAPSMAALAAPAATMAPAPAASSAPVAQRDAAVVAQPSSDPESVAQAKDDAAASAASAANGQPMNTYGDLQVPTELLPAPPASPLPGLALAALVAGLLLVALRLIARRSA